MYPISFHRRDEARAGNAPHIQDIGLIPSISFHRFNNSRARGTSIDSLTFRFGTDIYTRNFPGFRNQFFWINATYDTDFKFESSILAVEGEWRPISFSHEIGTIYKIPSLEEVSFYWQPWLHVEAGEVFNGTRNTTLADGFEFARGGAALEASLWWGRHLKLYADFHYYHPIITGSGTARNVTAGLDFFPIPDNDTLALTIEYENGKIPLKLHRTETVTVGLSVKF